MRLISAATVVVLSFWLVGVLGGATRPLHDPDVWWHIRAGQLVLETGSVPRTDTWSIAGGGNAWTSQDWLTNVLLAVGHSLGPRGWTLLSVAFGLLAVAAFAFLWSAIGSRRADAGWSSRVLALTAGVVLAGPVMGVRAQVLDLLFGAAVVWVLWRFVAGAGVAVLAVLPAVALLWVNTHAGWPLLFLLAGAALVGEAADRLTGRPLAPAAVSWPRLAWLAAAMVVSAVALVLNPNGAAIYAYPFETVEIAALSSFVGEWQPARLDSQAGQLLAAWVALALVPTVALAWRRMRTLDLLVLVGLTLMAAVAVRFLLIAGPITAALVALHLGPVVRSSRLGRAVDPPVQRLSRPRGGLPGIVNLALAVAVATLGAATVVARSLPATQRATIAESQPVEAVDWLQDNPVGKRVFNRYEWGGYLGLHRPELPIFIDGRADVYGDQAILRYVETISLNVDPQQTFDRHAIDHVLYAPDSRLGGWLEESPGWQRVYADDVAAVWVRRSG